MSNLIKRCRCFMAMPIGLKLAISCAERLANCERKWGHFSKCKEGNGVRIFKVDLTLFILFILKVDLTLFILTFYSQLYTSGTEPQNDYTTSQGVTWEMYASAKAKVIPSISYASMYADAQAYFAQQGVKLAGFVQWSQC